jgi:hypothetical protein
MAWQAQTTQTTETTPDASFERAMMPWEHFHFHAIHCLGCSQLLLWLLPLQQRPSTSASVCGGHRTPGRPVHEIHNHDHLRIEHGGLGSDHSSHTHTHTHTRRGATRHS